MALMDSPAFKSAEIALRTAGRGTLFAYARALACKSEAERTRQKVLARIAPCRAGLTARQSLIAELRRQRSLKKHRPALYSAAEHLTVVIAYGAECRRPKGSSPREAG